MKKRDEQNIVIELPFENNTIEIKLEKKYGWRIGGDFVFNVNKTINNLNIRRLHEKEIENGEIEICACFDNIKKIETLKISNKHKKTLDNNIMLLYSIDGTSNDNLIRIEDKRNKNIDGFYSKNTSRNKAAH